MHSNHDFTEKLLNSFEVDTYRSKKNVRTADFDAVKQVEKTKPFKYAIDRQDAFEKTVEMIDSRKIAWKSNPPSKSEVDLMKNLRDRGASYSEIGERLYERYGYSLDSRDIRKILLGKKKEKKGA